MKMFYSLMAIAILSTQLHGMDKDTQSTQQKSVPIEIPKVAKLGVGYVHWKQNQQSPEEENGYWYQDYPGHSPAHFISKKTLSMELTPGYFKDSSEFPESY